MKTITNKSYDDYLIEKEIIERNIKRNINEMIFGEKSPKLDEEEKRTKHP